MGGIRQVFLFVTFAGCILLPAQTAAPPTPPPQSARQALIEMFMGKGENDFARHLPEAARQTLIHKGETPDTSIILKISTIGRQAAAQGEHLETFDEGSTLLAFDQSSGREKTELAVEHDSLLGEDDEIELSIHYYKDGQLQSLPVVPQLIFTLRQEKGNLAAHGNYRGGAHSPHRSRLSERIAPGAGRGQRIAGADPCGRNRSRGGGLCGETSRPGLRLYVIDSFRARSRGRKRRSFLFPRRRQ
jgi:hypothetical protein